MWWKKRWCMKTFYWMNYLKNYKTGLINQGNYRDVGTMHLWHQWKMSSFCTHLSSLFLSVWMDPNWVRLHHHPWKSQLRLPTSLTPHSHLLWYFCSISIIFSRRFHHTPCSCNWQLFTTKNQFKLNSIFCCKTQAKKSHL